MITVEQVRAALAQRVKAEAITMSDDAMAMAVEDIDIGKERVAAAQHFRWRVWDRTSPIGDVSAEQVLARPDVVGEAYIIERDGRVLVFQGHKPGASGLAPMSALEASQMAVWQVETFVDDLALRSAVDGIVQRWKRVHVQTTIPATDPLTLLRGSV